MPEPQFKRLAWRWAPGKHKADWGGGGVRWGGLMRREGVDTEGRSLHQQLLFKLLF